MAELYLIAHKVRSEPAFDIAERMRCPICTTQVMNSEGQFEPSKLEPDGCAECDGEGFWWIIGTSGHRAYPFWHSDLMGLIDEGTGCHAMDGWLGHTMKNMPEGLPDHYPTRQAKPEKSSGKSLLAALGLLPKVVRRL